MSALDEHDDETRAGQSERERRQRVLKGGSILDGIEKSEVACAIRNMHESGAELRVPPEAAIPAEFLLYVPIDRTAYRCELRWRVGTRVGVKFNGTAPKPHWHYG